MILLVAGMVVTTMLQETIAVSGYGEGGGESSVLIDNPIGISGVPNAEGGTLGVATLLLFFVIIVGAIASMVVRFRRSRGTERQQLKWFTYAVALLFLLPLGDFAPLGGFVWDEIVFPAVIAFIPVATGIAILRYRLYDIDVVINRTLVYGLLTAILAASYLGIVAVTQLILQPLTPQSDLSIVISTLAVAALFRPLRARLQTFIDRRFYRQRYAAAGTLDRFSARLRDQVDLESLRSEVVGVVGTTMQPAHASLWLRPREEAR
jgi:4-amino-4-deoxy-L-arabinose transferase-like glycosyltransferase